MHRVGWYAPSMVWMSALLGCSADGGTRSGDLGMAGAPSVPGPTSTSPTGTAPAPAGSTPGTSTEWDEPKPKLYDPPLVIPSNSIITYSCDYNNDTGMTLKFGQSAQSNEMCILFTQFYATQPSSPQGQSLTSLI